MDTHKNQFRQISIYWNGQKRDLARLPFGVTSKPCNSDPLILSNLIPLGPKRKPS